MSLNISESISFLSMALSVIAFSVSLYDKKIKLDAYLYYDGKNSMDNHYLDIYNNSTRKIIITHFEIYRSRFKYLSHKSFAETWYSEGDDSKCTISPFDSSSVIFNEQYDITRFISIAKQKHQGVYISIYVAGKKTKTIKLI